ncbi:hypothetical protein NU219Hw_g7852t1 [Hortaea werneckii]
MTRNQRGRPHDLGQSWDAMEEDYESDEPIYDETDEREEMQDSYRSQQRHQQSSIDTSGYERQERPRRSARLQSEEAELIMPSSPDAGRSKAKSSAVRDTTPRMRMLPRSMTGDAGKIGKQSNLRASTPHIRANQRSLTSDAGLFKHSADPEEEDGEEISVQGSPRTAWNQIARPLLAYLLDVIALALHYAKPLLGYALLAYMIMGAIVFGGGFLTNSINNALTPICRIPGSSWLNLPFCTTHQMQEMQGIAEFDKLVEAQSQFEDVLDSMQVGATLPVVMKRTESSIRDLKHVVEYSALPSRGPLRFEFTGFIEIARRASRDLSRFNSRIGRAVDHILSTNRWTISVLEGMEAEEEAKGAVARWVSDNLNIFSPFQPVSLSEDILFDQYLRHTSAVEEQILTLISEAQALLNILDDLDSRIDVIGAIATRDGIETQGKKDELFAILWTKLGGNRSNVAKLEQQLKLLRDIETYRKLAWGHVTTTMLNLQSIQDNLETLRESVAMPETIGNRLPLEMHIDSITRGVERLEARRDRSRQLEQESYNKVLARAEQGEKRVIDGKEL